jgi:lipopolysaccharide transport system ATP-binding protein
MNLPVLKINNIGKAYRTYSSHLMRFASWFGFKTKAIQETWTLKYINFKLMPGEAVGIIGQNGAGKSTLLKIITGTLKPSTGNVVVRGKIAAILELGMGFHPDLTGRQNAYHAAGLMGYTHEQIDSVIDDIEAFAEIGEYFEQPVRVYSSGMQVRVAFAVATAFRPEVLIIDEALSVGDTYFQHKSFERIKQFREAGTSLLFVSHDKGAILALCDRAILIEKGQVLKDDEPESVTDYYNALIAEKENATVRQEKKEDGRTVTISGTGEAQVVEIGLYNQNNDLVEVVNVGESVSLRVTVQVNADLPYLVLGYGIKDRLGQVIFGTNTWHTKQTLSNVKENEVYVFNIQFPACFGVGSYSVQTALVDSDTHLTANYEWKDLALVFSVANLDKHHFAGILWQEPEININKKS